MSIFNKWADLNMVMGSGRSRFDILQEKLDKCTTKKEASKALVEEGYNTQYPLLPEDLK